MQIAALKKVASEPAAPEGSAGQNDAEVVALRRSDAELRAEVKGLKVKLAQISVAPERSTEAVAQTPEAGTAPIKCPRMPEIAA